MKIFHCSHHFYWNVFFFFRPNWFLERKCLCLYIFVTSRAAFELHKEMHKQVRSNELYWWDKNTYHKITWTIYSNGCILLFYVLPAKCSNLLAIGWWQVLIVCVSSSRVCVLAVLWVPVTWRPPWSCSEADCSLAWPSTNSSPPWVLRCSFHHRFI